MNTNDKPHNSHYPYKLLGADGKIGCYEEMRTAQEIGRSARIWHQVIHYQHGVVDESY